MPTYQGSCHCGAIGFEFYTKLPPSEWDVRACQCSFCKAHAAACTSDPLGRVAIACPDESKLQRYRFGLHTADFLVCRNCGVYLGAVLTGATQSFATINTNAMPSLHPPIPAPRHVEYGCEPSDARVHRRLAKWTPVVEHI